MGNKIANPVASFEEATRTYSEEEIEQIRTKFNNMCQTNHKALYLENFIQISQSPTLRKRLLPRLFEVMDIKKENEIQFESYFCTLSMLRRNNNEEISKFLLLLYGNPKSRSMRRESISDLLLDANTTYDENDSADFDVLQKRSNCMHDLLSGMVDVVFHQYATTHPGDKLTFSEFCEFVRDDASIQRFVWLLPSCLTGVAEQGDKE